MASLADLLILLTAGFAVLLAGLTGLAVLMVGREFSISLGLRRQLDRRVGRLAAPSTEEGERQRRRSYLSRLGDSFDRSAMGLGLAQSLDRADLRQLKPSEFVAIVFGIMVALYLAFSAILRLGWPDALMAFAIAIFGSRAYLNGRRDHYRRAFDAQLIDVSTLMANSLRAGLSIHQAIEVVSKEMAPPAGYEFGRVRQEFRLGEELDKALKDMVERIGSNDFRVLITAILVQRQVGGDLVKALAVMTKALEERLKLSQKIETMTAEVRYSNLLLPVIASAGGVALNFMLPGLLRVLFTTLPGFVILVLFIISQIVAYTFVSNVANVEV
ncbi:MAG: type II secretion system F family protein [Chloroflexi bacterium]|nr:type II secretion system F family protein [Chloroflexota bacterium]